MIKLGSNSIGKIYLGSNSIGKAYFGSNLVFQKGVSPTPPGPTPSYTLVDYIQGDGTAYIDTGIKGNAPISMNANLVPVAPASGNAYIIGARKDSGDTRLFMLSISSAKYAGLAYAGSIYTSDIDVSASTDNETSMIAQVIMTAGSQQIFVNQDGESSYTSASHTISGGLTTGLNIFLFTFNNQGTPSTVSNISGMKFRWVKIYDDGTFTNLV